MRVIGYTRVSTEEQGNSGLGLEAQEHSIRATCELRGWDLLRIEQDIASGRKRNGRASLDRAMASCQAGDAEGVVAVKLDRLARSVPDFYGLVKQAEAGGFAIVTADGLVDLTSASGRMISGLLAVIAEWESEMISERTRDALAAAKAKGIRVGRPPSLDEKTLAEILVLREQGVSLERIADYLDEQGVPTPRGGAKWRKGSIHRMLKVRGL